jgi:hypothetical protein
MLHRRLCIQKQTGHPLRALANSSALELWQYPSVVVKDLSSFDPLTIVVQRPQSLAMTFNGLSFIRFWCMSCLVANSVLRRFPVIIEGNKFERSLICVS